MHAPTYLSLRYRYKTRHKIEAFLIVSHFGDVSSYLFIRRVGRILGSKKWEHLVDDLGDIIENKELGGGVPTVQRRASILRRPTAGDFDGRPPWVDTFWATLAVAQTS